MRYDRDEAVRYMGARKDDRKAAVLADTAYLKLRNEVQARSVYRVLDCEVDEGGVLLDGEYFKSAKLAAHIKGCVRAVLLAATLGAKADIMLRRMAVANIAEGAAGQAVCTALIETYCDETEAKISAEYGGLHFKPRFSPGYADWALTDQPRLLRMLDAQKRIGLTVTAGGMLAPVKSVTAIIGITNECENKTSNCKNCENNANCIYKKTVRKNMLFKDLLGKKTLFFDGAMGTMLQAAGLKPGELPELWNFSHAGEVEKIHTAYLNAGADIIKTNTFGANRLKFAGTEIKTADVIEQAVAIAKKACAKKPGSFVALDMGPTGKLLAPYGDLPFEEAVSIYAEIVQAGVKSGADLILIETMSDTYELKAALLAAKENSSLPVVATMTLDEGGKLLTGGDITAAAVMLEGLGADAIGFNCGLGPAQMQKLLPQLLAATPLPAVLNPNAGLPKEVNGQTVFDVDAEEFSQLMYAMAQDGCLAIMGGCCGTTPEHIAALVNKCRNIVPQQRSCGLTAVAAYGSAVVIGQKPVIIGERINPTGKPRLKQAILNGDYDYICRLGLEQIDRGAGILDVNVGVPGIDEAAVSAEAVQRLQAITSVPLQIDTSNYEAMARSLRLYNGKPLLNSVCGKEESLEKVLPLVKKYGAAVVALTLDDSGIPQTAEGRIAIAEKIIAHAAEYGIEKRNIIVDPLALTISTGSDNANIDLQVLSELKKRGIKTVMGVSNISFGLPARDAVNSAFFVLAMQAGLSCAIINPQSETMMNAYYAFGALSGLDEGCKEYVAMFAGAAQAKQQPMQTAEYTLYEAIVKGLREQSEKAVKEQLAGKQPLDIINAEMIPALDYVGKGFEERRIFLPQLLMSAEAAKAAFNVIRDKMAAEGGSQSNGIKVILATVKGDIHDIGKNIVKVLFENYGYQVIDLGKDVPPEKITETAVQNNVSVVGLSALMTTTVGAMEETIKALRAAGDFKIIVGGAVLTQDYADSIGADCYAPNAVSAVNYANSLQ